MLTPDSEVPFDLLNCYDDDSLPLSSCGPHDLYHRVGLMRAYAGADWLPVPLSLRAWILETTYFGRITSRYLEQLYFMLTLPVFRFSWASYLLAFLVYIVCYGVIITLSRPKQEPWEWLKIKFLISRSTKKTFNIIIVIVRHSACLDLECFIILKTSICKVRQYPHQPGSWKFKVLTCVSMFSMHSFNILWCHLIRELPVSCSGIVPLYHETLDLCCWQLEQNGKVRA